MKKNIKSLEYALKSCLTRNFKYASRYDNAFLLNFKLMNIEFIRCGDRINDSNKKNVRKVSTFACTQLAVS